MSDVARKAQKVVETEAQALSLLAASMPPDLPNVVQRILDIPGRVIVCGIGKSGHVARKISATLASTGTPSFFVHATEASHGDMGMITPDDLCITISNSGETQEMRDVVAHTRRFSIPLVAITSKGESTLARAADHCLTLPAAPEACPMGLAPTTSAVLTMALGDALAVALMARRGFQAEEYRVFHPGGSLGARLSTAAQIMHTGAALPLVDIDAPMEDVLIEMTSKGFGVAGVIAEGALAAIVTDGDLRRNMARLIGSRARDVATLDPVTVAPDMLAAEVLALLNSRKISAVFVIDAHAAPLGIVHLHDLLRAGVA
ncbi:MAG: KpsF/GutQ family sugar-phosphate isomerase [Pseudomonadota bacterium]